jgi:hypothetical protein
MPDEMKLPKIYVFSNVRGGGDGVCYAMAEDGTVLGSHYCSNESFARGDLGVIPGTRQDRHESHYAKHYPNGYEMEFVHSSSIDIHAGLQAAFKLNKAQAEASPPMTNEISAAAEIFREYVANGHQSKPGKAGETISAALVLAEFALSQLAERDETDKLPPLNAHQSTALNRVLNSDASGIDHREIYGYPIDRDLSLLGRYLVTNRVALNIPTTDAGAK